LLGIGFAIRTSKITEPEGRSIGLLRKSELFTCKTSSVFSVLTKMEPSGFELSQQLFYFVPKPLGFWCKTSGLVSRLRKSLCSLLFSTALYSLLLSKYGYSLLSLGQFVSDGRSLT
jgi:hypothetical protein